MMGFFSCHVMTQSAPTGYVSPHENDIYDDDTASGR